MAPKAFGFLAESIVSHGGDPGAAEVSCESDYAEAVELGTRGAPRKAPPLDKIIAWVQLRGIQGLSAKGNLIRLPRSVKVFRNQVSRGRYHARTVAAEIRNQVGGSEGAAAWRAHTMNDSGVLPATLAVARAIQMKIKNVGTKPRRFMLNSIPIAEAFLDYYVKQALTDNYQYV